ncbi:MAG TPA: hypothetical protein VMS55_03090 [Myxococcota bacterium]|nr:hypothetical protein [Myxococcota bacterium]
MNEKNCADLDFRDSLWGALDAYEQKLVETDERKLVETVRDRWKRRLAVRLLRRGIWRVSANTLTEILGDVDLCCFDHWNKHQTVAAGVTWLVHDLIEGVRFDYVACYPELYERLARLARALAPPAEEIGGITDALHKQMSSEMRAERAKS